MRIPARPPPIPPRPARAPAATTPTKSTATRSANPTPPSNRDDAGSKADRKGLFASVRAGWNALQKKSIGQRLYEVAHKVQAASTRSAQRRAGKEPQAKVTDDGNTVAIRTGSGEDRVRVERAQHGGLFVSINDEPHYFTAEESSRLQLEVD